MLDVWQAYHLSKQLHWPYPDVVRQQGHRGPISAREMYVLTLIHNHYAKMSNG